MCCGFLVIVWKIVWKSVCCEKVCVWCVFLCDVLCVWDGDVWWYVKCVGVIEGNGCLGNVCEWMDGCVDGWWMVDMLMWDDSVKVWCGDDFGKGVMLWCVMGFGVSDGLMMMLVWLMLLMSLLLVIVGVLMSLWWVLFVEVLWLWVCDGVDGGMMCDVCVWWLLSEDSEYLCDENFVLKSVGGGVDVGVCVCVGSGWDVDVDVVVCEVRDLDEGGFVCELCVVLMLIDILCGSDGMLYWKICV